MNETLKSSLILFFTQILMYMILCVNYRAVAQGNYLQSVISDFMIASASFFIIKKIAKDESKGVWMWLGFAMGGVVGTIIGIWISKSFLTP